MFVQVWEKGNHKIILGMTMPIIPTWQSQGLTRKGAWLQLALLCGMCQAMLLMFQLNASTTALCCTRKVMQQHLLPAHLCASVHMLYNQQSITVVHLESNASSLVLPQLLRASSWTASMPSLGTQLSTTPPPPWHAQ
jgi:hypothetical protein